MPWCPKCKYEYREGYTTCSDCEIELVQELETTNNSKKKHFKTILFISIFALLAWLFYFVPQISFDRDTNDAKKVVKAHFNYYNSENTKFIKLLYIKAAPELISDYRNYGYGAVEKPYNVRVFNITYVQIYKNNKLAPDPSVLKSKHITVTKRTKGSPWLVIGIGEG